MELPVVQLTRSVREANFDLYVVTLDQLFPWFFLLDHTHNSRWLPVHVRDLKELRSRHLDVYKNFTEGKFVAHQTSKKFSAIALDHAHEQLNADLKGHGGIIGITENQNALVRWATAGPEVANLIQELEVKFFAAKATVITDTTNKSSACKMAFSRM